MEHEASGGQCEHDAAEDYGYSEGPLMAGLDASFGYPRRFKKSSCWGSIRAIEFVDYHSRLDAFLREP
jgi:hypothetical protein